MAARQTTASSHAGPPVVDAVAAVGETARPCDPPPAPPALPPRLRAVVYTFSEGQLRVTDASEQLAVLLGVPRQALLDSPSALCDLLHPDDRDRFRREHAEVCAGGSLSSEYRLLTTTGETVWIYDEAEMVHDAPAGVPRLVGFCIDVSRRKGVEEALRASNERFRAVTANIPGAVYRCEIGQQWTIRFMSDYIEQLVGYPSSDFIDSNVRSYASIICRDDRPLVIETVAEALRESSDYAIEYRLLHADGTPRWIAERGRVVLDAEGRPAWLDGVILDISRAKLAEHARDRAEAQLRHQALHDSLTGLPNRTMFHACVSEALEKAKRENLELHLLMLDLDRFKEINDTLGHAAGDELLKEVAHRLAATTRASDVIARLGGDEFSILVKNASARDLPEIADRVARCLEEPIAVDDLPLNVEVSIGMASFPADSADAQELLQRADVAMYLAKTGNCGYASYDAAMDRHEPRSLSLLGELRGAIDRRELVLFYQPQVALRGGEVAGVEALVRWQHPERGLIPPGDFVPLAQETGLIKQLTEYVLEEAVRQCRAWMDDGRFVRVAVNLAMRNLIDVALADEVALLLEAYGVPPALLEFEITENAIVADPWRIQTVLERLGTMGVRLSIDDFGTGYSSLSYLKRLPIDEIKIDRSFVTKMIASSEDEVIVKSTIDLGRNLGLEVVAEGVETLEVLERLGEFGCHLAQGFFLSKPLPPRELESWMSSAAGGLPGALTPL